MIRNSDEAEFTAEIGRVLAPYFNRARFAPGQILWHEGEAAGRMITIITGKVKIFRSLPNGKQASIYIFGSGDTFGFLPFIDGGPYPASAEVLEDTHAQIMTRGKLLSAMREDPEIAIFLMGQLAKRLRGAFDQIERISTRGVLPRVAAALASLSAQTGKTNRLEIISLPVSSHDYAELTGLTPESFSRGITRLVDMGILHRLRANTFQILDPQRLEKVSRQDI